jgi:isochorismate pyruvate lyase
MKQRFANFKEKLAIMIPADACTTIEEVRNGIDELDRTIITALGQRFHYVKAVTRFKKNAEEVRAPERYQAVINSRRAWAIEAGLNPDVIEEMYRHLIAHFIDEEMKLVHRTE